MLKLFKQPMFQDSEETRKAQLFYKILVGSSIIVSSLEIIEWIALPQNYWRWIAIICSYNFICLSLLYLNKKGYYRIASFIFIGFLVVLIYGLAWTAGGIKAPAIQEIPMVVLLVGLIVSWKRGIQFALGIIITCLGFVVADYLGYLPVSRVTPNSLSLWENFALRVSILALLQYLVVANLDKALQEAKKELTLRSNTEKELRRSEAFRKRVFEGSKIPIIVMDAISYSYIDCNQAAINIYGYSSKEEVLGKLPIQFSAPTQYDGTSSEEKAKFYIEKALIENSVVFEWKHQRPNGDFWDAEVHLMSFQIDNQQMLQFTLLDITERKKTEMSLHVSESRLESISNNFKSGMIYQVVIKPDGTRKFTYLSDSVQQLYGILPKEGLADPTLIYDKIHEDDVNPLIEAENDAVKKCATFKAEARIKNPSGEMRWSSFVSTPKMLEDGSICFDGIEFIITEIKNAEAELRTAKLLLEQTIEQSPVPMILVGMPDAVLRYVNPACRKFLGIDDEPSYLDTPLHDYKASFQDFDIQGKLGNLEELPLTRSLMGLRTDGEERYIVRKDGTIRYELVNGTPIFDDAGNIIAGYLIMLDITERKLAESKLKKSEERFRLILENMPILLNAFDENGNFIVWNKACENVTGYQADEIIGNPKAMELLYPEPDYRSKVWNSSLETKNKNDEFNLIAKNGEVRTIEWFDIYQHLSITGWASWGMGLDITERKRAVEALKKSEKKFSKAFKTSPEAITIASMENGTYIDVNDVFLKTTGYKRYEVIGKTSSKLNVWVNPEERQQFVNELSKNGSLKNFEVQFRMNNHDIRDFLVSSEIIELEGQQCSLNFILDITERKQAERELKKYRDHLELLVQERTEELAAANEELKATNDELYHQKEELQTAISALNTAQNRLVQSEKMASLGILSAGIAHEINNPLNFIQGGSIGIERYFNDNLKEHLENVAPLLNAINVGVKRASDIVTSLSHYNRQDDLPFTNCDIHSIIDNCLIMLQSQLKTKVEITKLYTEQNIKILGNEGKLHQAMLNIISNAEQAIEKSGSIDINTMVMNQDIIITIADSGSGISQDNLQKIFDPFFTTKAPGKGTGLGLSITYDIIQEHNGSIEYESQLGKGSKATIKLPISKKEIL